MNNETPKPKTASGQPSDKPAAADNAKPEAENVEELGGPKGPDPTRFGDWSVKGRCIDF